MLKGFTQFFIFLMLFNVPYILNVKAVIKLRPITQKVATQKKEKPKDEKIHLDQKKDYSFLFHDLHLLAIDNLINNFIIKRLEKDNFDKDSVIAINKLRFIKGNFDEITMSPGINIQQLWMLFFSKFNQAKNINENNLPLDDLSNNERLKYRFMLSCLQGDFNKSEFIYNLYIDGGDQQKDVFWDIARFVLYDIAPEKKYAPDDLDFTSLALLAKKGGAGRVIDLSNYELKDKEKMMALANIDGVDEEIAIQLLELLQNPSLLQERYMRFGRKLIKAGGGLNGEAFDQLSNQAKRAILFYTFFTNINQNPNGDNDKQGDNDIVDLDNIDLALQFINLCRKGKVFAGYNIIAPFIRTIEPSADVLFVAPEFIKVFAYVGDKDKMLSWLNFLRENSPSDWIKVSVFDVFSYNKSFVDKDKTFSWLQNVSARIKIDEASPIRAKTKIDFLGALTRSILLEGGASLQKDKAQKQFIDQLIEVVDNINLAIKENDFDLLSNNLLKLKSLGLSEYIPLIVLNILSYYDI